MLYQMSETNASLMVVNDCWHFNAVWLQFNFIAIVGVAEVLFPQTLWQSNSSSWGNLGNPLSHNLQLYGWNRSMFFIKFMGYNISMSFYPLKIAWKR